MKVQQRVVTPSGIARSSLPSAAFGNVHGSTLGVGGGNGQKWEGLVLTAEEIKEADGDKEKAESTYS